MNRKETARALLATWANQQDGWVRSIVSELLVTRSPVGDRSLERSRDILLAEKGLAKESLEKPIPSVVDGGAALGQQADLRLGALADVAHVNALTGGQSIEFHPSLTVLFGENAAGKSGYCRILKRLANVRSVEEILDDVESKAPGTPVATIKYSLGSDQHELRWNNAAGVAPFGRIAVFDSRATGLHVDDELNYQYTPGDLLLYRLCHSAVEGVRKLLDEYIQARRVELPFSSSAFARGTEVFALFESLGPATDVAKLQALGAFREQEEEDLRNLQISVAALQPDNLDNRAKAASGDIELFAEMLRVLDALIGFDVNLYHAVLSEAAAARDLVLQTTKTAFERAAIRGQTDETWRQFIDSAENFVAATHAPDFPHSGDKCPYCQQTLSDAAVKLLADYRALVRSEGQRKADACAARLAACKEQLATLDVEALRARMTSRMESVPGSSQLAQSLDPVLSAAQELTRRVRAHESLGSGWSLPAGTTGLREHLATIANQAADNLRVARSEAKEREAALLARTTQLRGLQDRQKLAQHLPLVLEYLEEARWQTRAVAITKLLPKLLRSLTDVAKQASAVALHEDFEARFFAECKRLRAPQVKLDFPGRKGEAARRKVVAGKHRVSDILSEGEQKVVALADFLAEASLQGSTAPVVLDDPVNSLDYRRIDEVVARLVAISHTQQVIVFTHNIWFASLLLDEAKKDCKFYQIRDDGRQKGLVSLEVGPRTDGLSALGGTVNELIQSAGAAEGAIRQALVESAYGSLRAWCEVVVERELLQQVVTRYQPMVRLTTLDKIKPEALKVASARIVPVYERACRAIVAHSQPLETLNVRPTLDDLKADWAEVQRALKDHRAA